MRGVLGDAGGRILAQVGLLVLGEGMSGRVDACHEGSGTGKSGAVGPVRMRTARILP